MPIRRAVIIRDPGSWTRIMRRTIRPELRPVTSELAVSSMLENLFLGGLRRRPGTTLERGSAAVLVAICLLRSAG